MSALIVVAAFAQAAAATGPTPVPSDAAAPHAGSSTYVDLEGGAGYSTNPFLSLDSSGGQGFGRISVHAVHSRISERSTTVLSAYAQDTTYTSRWGSEQSFDLNGRHDTAVSERLRLFGDVDVALDKGGQLDTRIIGVPDVPLEPGTAAPPVLVLPGSDFLTVRGKEFRASGHVGGQLALSPTQFITLSTGADHVDFKTGGLDTRYTMIPVTFGYQNKLSERTTIGAQVAAQRTDYNGPSHFQVISPELTGIFLLSERVTFSGAVGASFASIDNGIETRHSSGLTANASLCSSTQRGHLCMHAEINQATATVAGPSKSESVGVDYQRQLNANQTIQLSLAADHYSNPTSFVVGQTFSRGTYLRAVADYTRRFGNRLFGGLDLSARKLVESGPDPRTDLSASLFIRYRFGDVQ